MTEGKRNVLITGASRGLGLALARHFKSLGYHVIGTARNTSTAAELAKEADEVLELDVKSTESINAFVSALANRHIHLFISNAGILHNLPLADVTAENLQEEFAVNAVAPFLLCRGLVSTCSRLERVLYIGSMLGSTSLNKDGGRYGYRASKAAGHSLMKSFAVEHVDVPVLLLHPGHVKTDMGGELGKITVEQSIENMMRVVAQWEAGKIASATLIDSMTGLEMPF